MNVHTPVAELACLPAKTQIHEFAQARGNRAVLVLVDSSRPEFAFLLPVLRALDHCGVPFRLLDLSWQRLGPLDLDACAAVVLAQEHAAVSLTASDVDALLHAVQNGLGLVNLDFDLGSAPSALATALGLTGRGAGEAFTYAALASLTTRSAQHYITRTRRAGDVTPLRGPLAYIEMNVASETDVLVESDSGAPIVVARALGRGRAVQWAVSPRLWLRELLGFAHGLDDLFWKSIVWVARKPFVLNAMPPFVRMRFDDCTGFWRDPVDFAFLDPFIRRGHRPNVSLNVRAVTPAGAERIASLSAAGNADFAAHTLDANTSVWFERGHGAYSVEEMANHAQEVDDAFARWGISQSHVLSDHEHEFGHTALPYLRARGIRYEMNVNLPDERAEGVHCDWRPAPYGSMSYAFDVQPRSGMFVVFNHFPAFDHSRTYLEDGRHFYLNRTGGVGECKWDFLNGLTCSTRGSAGTDVEQAAQRLALHTARGFDSLFFGGSITHSHFIRDVAPGEWDAILDRADRLLSGYAPRYTSYDHLAAYAESRVNTVLEEVHAQATGAVVCSVRGKASVPLDLSWFVDDGGTDVRRSFKTLATFDGRQTGAVNE